MSSLCSCGFPYRQVGLRNWTSHIQVFYQSLVIFTAIHPFHLLLWLTTSESTPALLGLSCTLLSSTVHIILYVSWLAICIEETFFCHTFFLLLSYIILLAFAWHQLLMSINIPKSILVFFMWKYVLFNPFPPIIIHVWWLRSAGCAIRCWGVCRHVLHTLTDIMM